jgi:ankyrin repeat protein
LYHQNIPLIKLLCENGVMLPNEWLTEENLVLPSTLSSDLKSEMTLCIDRCLINRRLHLAAARGDLNDLIRCQRRGADIDWSNCYGSTALLYAIQYGNSFPVVHALVSCGASMLHTNNSEPMSLLDLAKKQNNREIANYLRKELNVQFLSAILSNDRASMEKFAQLGVDFNFQDEQQRTALHYAVQYQDADLVTWLCECGSSPYTPDINGDYPMMLAIERGMGSSSEQKCKRT